MAASLQELAFKTATKFAVVGASDAKGKLGTLLFARCLKQALDVKPINPFCSEVQGKTCLKSLRELQDPSHTAVFIAVPPRETLKVLQEAKELDVLYIWLFQDRTDDACRQYIRDSQLESRCIISDKLVSPKLKVTISETVPPAGVTSSTEEPTRPPKDAEDTAQTTGPCDGFIPDWLRDTAVGAVKATVSAIKRKGEDLSSTSPSKIAKLATPARCRTLDEGAVKEQKFLSLTNFAVVGASDDLSKYGAKIFKCLRDNKWNVVPVNPNTSQVQGAPSFKTISELPDPKQTALSIVVHPEVTLKILEEAKNLDVPMIWIQPGAQDDAVLKYIASSGLEDRCIYMKPHSHSLSLLDAAQGDTADSDVTIMTDGPCPIGIPSLLDAVGTMTQQVAAHTADVVKSNVSSMAASAVDHAEWLRPCLLARLSA